MQLADSYTDIKRPWRRAAMASVIMNLIILSDPSPLHSLQRPVIEEPTNFIRMNPLLLRLQKQIYPFHIKLYRLQFFDFPLVGLIQKISS